MDGLDIFDQFDFEGLKSPITLNSFFSTRHIAEIMSVL